MTDINTELLLFFYIQKRVETLSEEIGILYEAFQNHILSENFERAEGHIDEAKKHTQLAIATSDTMKEKTTMLETYKTKRDALMEIIEGEE